jgi:cupin fold WbuC family metalloprotein
MKILNSLLLDSLSSQAKENSRLRKNLNLHASYDEPSQRLLNAMEPGSYIRPHRHLQDAKPECFIGVRGKLALIIFNEQGDIDKAFIFGPDEDNFGADLPSDIWHTVVSLKTGSIFFETKQGPYTPICKNDMAPWAPEEGTSEAISYLAKLANILVAVSSQ